MKIKNNKNIFLTTLIIFILFCGSIVAWIYFSKNDSMKIPKEKDINSSNNNPEKETAAGNIGSKHINKKPPSKTTPTNTDRANITVDDASGETTLQTYSTIDIEDRQIRISGQIAGLDYDDGTGECSFELTSPSGKISEIQTTILESPGNKYCQTVTKDISNFEAGVWKVTVKYKNLNQKYKGVSDAKNFTIQK